ncbi:hypothetical protein PYCC9005_000681 [Savitreella phatthalungensis]
MTVPGPLAQHTAFDAADMASGRHRGLSPLDALTKQHRILYGQLGEQRRRDYDRGDNHRRDQPPVARQQEYSNAYAPARGGPHQAVPNMSLPKHHQAHLTEHAQRRHRQAEDSDDGASLLSEADSMRWMTRKFDDDDHDGETSSLYSMRDTSLATAIAKLDIARGESQPSAHGDRDEDRRSINSDISYYGTNAATTPDTTLTSANATATANSASVRDVIGDSWTTKPSADLERDGAGIDGSHFATSDVVRDRMTALRGNQSLSSSSKPRPPALKSRSSSSDSRTRNLDHLRQTTAAQRMTGRHASSPLGSTFAPPSNRSPAQRQASDPTVSPRAVTQSTNTATPGFFRRLSQSRKDSPRLTSPRDPLPDPPTLSHPIKTQSPPMQRGHSISRRQHPTSTTTTSRQNSTDHLPPPSRISRDESRNSVTNSPRTPSGPSGSPAAAAGGTSAMDARAYDERMSRLSSLPDAAMDAGDHLSLGVWLHERDHLHRSTHHFAVAAAGGDLQACMFYGLALRHGWGVRQDVGASVAWLKKAVDVSISTPVGTTKKDRRAFDRDLLGSLAPSKHDLQSSPKQHDHPQKSQFRQTECAAAVYELAISYLRGWGVKADGAIAVRYLSIAGAWGDADACVQLADCLLAGIGCDRDKPLAARLLRLAEGKGRGEVGNSWIWKSKYD